MARLLRFALLIVLTFLMLSIVMAVARPETGASEKAVLVLAAGGLLALATPVRRIGSRRP
jgi:hypothetical protein